MTRLLELFLIAVATSCDHSKLFLLIYVRMFYSIILDFVSVFVNLLFQIVFFQFLLPSPHTLYTVSVHSADEGKAADEGRERANDPLGLVVRGCKKQRD